MASAPKKYGRHFLREWRLHKGLTLEQVGYQIGMSHQNLGKIERRDVRYIQDNLEALAKVYGCETADLVGRNPKDVEPEWITFQKLPEKIRKRALTIAKALAEEETAEG